LAGFFLIAALGTLIPERDAVDRGMELSCSAQMPVMALTRFELENSELVFDRLFALWESTWLVL
jgi:hypothetical protein